MNPESNGPLKVTIPPKVAAPSKMLPLKNNKIVFNVTFQVMRYMASKYKYNLAVN